MLDVARAARRAMAHVEGMSEEEFLAAPQVQDAVLYQVSVVGEAARRASVSYREAHPDLPWREMTGMRYKLIHDYDEVELRVVWETVTRDLPELLAKLAAVLPGEQPSP